MLRFSPSCRFQEFRFAHAVLLWRRRRSILQFVREDLKLRSNVCGEIRMFLPGVSGKAQKDDQCPHGGQHRFVVDVAERFTDFSPRKSGGLIHHDLRGLLQTIFRGRFHTNTNQRGIHKFARQRQKRYGWMFRKQVRLNNKSGPWFAISSLQCDGNQVAAPYSQFQPSWSAACSSHASVSASCGLFRTISDWRRHSAANPRFRVSGTQI